MSSDTPYAFRVMHRPRPSLPLTLLLILLIVVGLKSVAAGREGGDSGCEAAIEVGASSVHGCCDDHPENGRQPTCSDSFCPAGHCSPLAVLPSANMQAQARLPSEGGVFEWHGYVSHLSTPLTPPPIASRLS